ncbi:MAG: hypothetical protein FWD23_18145, partial [Oscillospiraceae bacterium]|nr:hypothetical protein [Oscillospiraceae bacterium]
MKNKKKRNRFIVRFILMLSICAMAIFGYKLREIQQNYQIGDEIYKELSDQIRFVMPPVLDTSQTDVMPIFLNASAAEPERKLKVEIPNMFIDF